MKYILALLCLASIAFAVENDSNTFNRLSPISMVTNNLCVDIIPYLSLGNWGKEHKFVTISKFRLLNNIVTYSSDSSIYVEIHYTHPKEPLNLEVENK